MTEKKRVLLTAEHAQLVNEAVASGDYGSTSEVTAKRWANGE